MKRKEWREVGLQSLYFVLVLVAMALLMAGANLVAGWLDPAQARPLEGEKLILVLSLWMLMFSMFLGLTPFAMDSSQKGMEYLLTLPLSRRALLLAKFLPRLTAVALFYLAYVLLYGLPGAGAFAGGFAFFSLCYFALYLISFSLAVVHENFIVQSILAGFALCGYAAACLLIVMLGFSWKFDVPAARVGAAIWHELSFDPPTLVLAVAVFLLMALPFVLSLFLAFDRFDLKPARAFNRRQLRFFVPLLLLAFGLCLGITYLVQGR